MAAPPKPRQPQAPTTPPRLERPPPQGVAPGASHGLEAREVGADAAFAAGLAKSGDLATDSAIRLFALAAATGATGRLTVAPEGPSFALTFRKGTLQHVATSSPDDDLPGFLVFRGIVQAEQVAEAATVAGAEGDLVGALVTLKLVNGSDLVRLIGEHAGQLVTRVLSVEAGGWSWEPGVPPPASAFPLGSPWVMLGAAVRALEPSAVLRRLGGREQLGVSRIAGRFKLEELRLGPAEARIAASFDGTRLSDLARARGPEAATVLRVALLLAEVELVAFAAPRPQAETTAAPAAAQAPPASPPPPPAQAPPPPAATPPPAAPAIAFPAATTPAVAPHAAPPPPPPPRTPVAIPKPPPAPPHPPPPAPVSSHPPPPTPVTTRPPAPPATARPPSPPAPSRPAPALDEPSLKALLASYTDADHFKVLGVGRDATPAQVKVAYFQLAKIYHPDTVAVVASPAVKKLCADLFSRIGEAWGVIGDDARRAQYVEDLASGASVSVDVMGILQAETVFQTGTLLVKARQYEEAAARFTEALELNAEEPEYGIWLAWCQFVGAAEKKKVHARAVASVEAGLKKSPRCVAGYLFLGQMAKIVGDLALAEKHLKRGLAVSPDHVDLQRELKYLRK